MKIFLSFLLGAGVLVSTALAQTGAPVTVTETATDFTLANGVVTARVLKRNGDLASLRFRDAEMLNDKSGHPGAYWSHDTTGGTELITRITIDPSANGGARAEVSVKGISGGKKMGHVPGVPAGAEGDLPVDIEIRYALDRDDSGIYTYCAFTHRPEYPAATMTEARFAAKLADTFDWMTVDAKRDKYFPADLREGDKYIYTATQFDNRAFGWSSTKDRIGFWLLNPSVEFLSGGPTKTGFLTHRDTTRVAARLFSITGAAATMAVRSSRSALASAGRSTAKGTRTLVRFSSALQWALAFFEKRPISSVEVAEILEQGFAPCRPARASNASVEAVTRRRLEALQNGKMLRAKAMVLVVLIQKYALPRETSKWTIIGTDP